MAAAFDRSVPFDVNFHIAETGTTFLPLVDGKAIRENGRALSTERLEVTQFLQIKGDTQLDDHSHKFKILETEHWLVNHRTDSALPGYLMIGSKKFTNDLWELPENALAELGPLFARFQRALRLRLDAKRVYIGRYGHMPGYPIHFHVIPIYNWVESLFWQDERYRALAGFGEPTEELDTDGAELTFFVWREFCERRVPPPVSGPSVSEIIGILRGTDRITQ